MTTRFRSKVDTWFVTLATLSGMAVIGLSLPMYRMDARAGLAASLIVTAFVLASLAWIVQSTMYSITDEELLIDCAGRRWQIPLHEIRRVAMTQRTGFAPALALDRLVIEYAVAASIVISPRDKRAFVRELDARRAASSSKSNARTTSPTRE